MLPRIAAIELTGGIVAQGPTNAKDVLDRNIAAVNARDIDQLKMMTQLGLQ